jgi:hypothetical protein
MFKSKNDNDLMIRTDNEYSFFDFCDRNDLIIEVTHKVGTEIERIEGDLTGYHPEISMFSLKGRQGFDYVIPIKNVELITVKGKL